jgi:hypothetical protein
VFNKLKLVNYLSGVGKIFNLKISFGPETIFHLKFANTLKELSLKGKLNGVWFHISNEGAFSKNYRPIFGMMLKAMGKHNGLPDLAFVSSKKSVFLELKAKNGKLSPFQKIFKEWCDSEGIRCEKIETEEEGLAILKEEGILND